MSTPAVSRRQQINAVTSYAWKKMNMVPGKEGKSHEKSKADIEKLRREVEFLIKVFSVLVTDDSIFKKTDHNSLVQFAKEIVSV